MSAKEALQAKLLEARRGKDSVRLSLLQVILGEVATLEARSGKPLTDEQVEGNIRKIAEANYTSLALVALGEGAEESAVKEAARKIADGDTTLLATVRQKNQAEYRRVCEEDGFLMTLLPKTLTVEQIKVELADVTDAIKAAKNDGQATGVAMKAIKAKSLKALGDHVSQAVRELRA